MIDQWRERGREIDESVDVETATTIARNKFANELAETTEETDVGYAEAMFGAIGCIKEMQAELEEMNRRLTEHGQKLDRLGDIGEEKTTKEQKIVAILSFADNIRNHNESKVVVKPKDIKGAVGCSRRYAYDLVDDMHESYSWAVDNTKREDRTTGLSGAESDSPPCGVLIDFDEVAHSEDGVVNKFTTRTAEEEVAD